MRFLCSSSTTECFQVMEEGTYFHLRSFLIYHYPPPFMFKSPSTFLGFSGVSSSISHHHPKSNPHVYPSPWKPASYEQFLYSGFHVVFRYGSQNCLLYYSRFSRYFSEGGRLNQSSICFLSVVSVAYVRTV